MKITTFVLTAIFVSTPAMAVPGENGTVTQEDFENVPQGVETPDHSGESNYGHDPQYGSSEHTVDETEVNVDRSDSFDEDYEDDRETLDHDGSDDELGDRKVRF